MAISSKIVLCSDPTTRVGARLTSPYPTFFVSKNLSSKQLAPTENIQLKSDNATQKVSSVVKGLNIYGLQYVNFPTLKSTSIVAVLQVPDGKGILVTANYGQVQSPCMECK